MSFLQRFDPCVNLFIEDLQCRHLQVNTSLTLAHGKRRSVNRRNIQKREALGTIPVKHFDEAEILVHNLVVEGAEAFIPVAVTNIVDTDPD